MDHRKINYVLEIYIHFWSYLQEQTESQNRNKISSQHTPFCNSSHFGHKVIVDMLIKGRTECNKSDKFSTTPLCEASRAGDIDIVYLLIKGSAD